MSERRGGRLAPLALAVTLLLYMVAAATAASAFTRAPGGVVGSGRELARIGQGVPFRGTDAVGALFVRDKGHLGAHFCTASVVHSPAGNVLITAAHCMTGQRLSPAGSVVFAPGYHDGRFPLGIWAVTGEFVTARWNSRHDPNDDVAFLIVSQSAAGAGPPRAQDGTGADNIAGMADIAGAADITGAHRAVTAVVRTGLTGTGSQISVEHAAGAERLAVNSPLPDLIDAIGYPDTTSRPISCMATALAYRTSSLRQMMFGCGGFTDGTSGGPLLSEVSARSGAGIVIGVIGGYQQGGYTPQISYSAVFAANVAGLYQRAVSRQGRG